MERIDIIRAEADYCLNCPTKPCTKGCPLENNIPKFIKCIKEEKYREAYDILCDTTVLQPICGRICPHERQCQGKCVRGIKGMPVQIGELEAFVGDMAIKEDYNIKEDNIEKKAANKNKKIAVVGSGPSGLTCAAFLARKGYNVTIYEKHDNLGGLLRYGIPEFRLDRDILDAQIQKIINLGINVVLGQELGKDYNLNELRKTYDAVFLGFGANISKKMQIHGEDLNGVYGGNELLEKNLHPDYEGKKIAVIGGGNVAMDVSRTIKKLGAEKVYVVYRRAEEQMPAEKKEIREAKEEGVEFLFQNNIVKINGSIDGNVESLECVKTELVKKEGSDRLVPVNIENSNYVLDIDYVVMAVGSEAEKSVVSNLGININKKGYIEIDENFMTSMPNVFAGGDLVGTSATVAWAAKNGRDAAEAISRIV